LRYESFYPFSRNQPPPQRPQGFGMRPFPGPAQPPGQPNQFGRPNNPFIDPRQGPGRNPPGQGPSKIDGYMDTVNRLINTAQQYAPVVQQFAPMMRNLPAMWKLYKGFQSMPSAGEGAGAAAAGGAARGASRAVPRTTEAFTPPAGPRPSVPRIFQPD
jgi:hypothetical protein